MAEQHVSSVEESLRASYEEILELDEALHRVRDRLRVGLYAISLANDPSFAAQMGEVAEHVIAGKPFDDACSADDFVRRIRARQPHTE